MPPRYYVNEKQLIIRIQGRIELIDVENAEEYITSDLKEYYFFWALTYRYLGIYNEKNNNFEVDWWEKAKVNLIY